MQRKDRKPVNFRVRTQANAYGVGYQDALDHIQDALATGGVEGVLEWLSNNQDRE